MSEDEVIEPVTPVRRPHVKYPTEQREAFIDSYIVWHVMSAQERLLAKMATNQKEWAEQHDIPFTTVAHWSKMPAVKKRIAELKTKRARVSAKPPKLETADQKRGQSNTEIFGDVIRRQLEAAAMGDKTALDFIKSANISKPFIDALNAEFQTDFPDKSDDELAEMFVDSFPDLVVGVLERRGWKVSK